jgi:hypothetical protein
LTSCDTELRVVCLIDFNGKLNWVTAAGEDETSGSWARLNETTQTSEDVDGLNFFIVWRMNGEILRKFGVILRLDEWILGGVKVG